MLNLFQHLTISRTCETLKRVQGDRSRLFTRSSIMKRPQFKEFEATSLYCPKCKAAVPVRKKLLLVLPEGDEYEYLCAYCASSVGMKIDKNASQIELILKP